MARDRGRPTFLSTRGSVLLALLLAGVWAFVQLDLGLADLVPTESGWQLAGEFFSRAFTPALEHETEFVPDEPLLQMSLEAAGRTLGYAAAAMSLALVLGLVLGFLGSSAWWSGEVVGNARGLAAVTRRIAPAVYAVSRVIIALMRSVHELLWALLFLVALGLSSTTAIIAIAIPYGGTLAKIFSEMIDEAPRGPALALRYAGASGIQVFMVGLLPSALPDMIAYGFYRFECALRSAAILGFLGVPTLGVMIRQGFMYGEYGEVWTHLYVLIVMVVVFDLWSGAVRRRIVQ